MSGRDSTRLKHFLALRSYSTINVTNGRLHNCSNKMIFICCDWATSACYLARSFNTPFLLSSATTSSIAMIEARAPFYRFINSLARRPLRRTLLHPSFVLSDHSFRSMSHRLLTVLCICGLCIGDHIADSSLLLVVSSYSSTNSCQDRLLPFLSAASPRQGPGLAREPETESGNETVPAMFSASAFDMEHAMKIKLRDDWSESPKRPSRALLVFVKLIARLRFYSASQGHLRCGCESVGGPNLKPTLMVYITYTARKGERGGGTDEKITAQMQAGTVLRSSEISTLVAWEHYEARRRQKPRSKPPRRPRRRGHERVSLHMHTWRVFMNTQKTDRSRTLHICSPTPQTAKPWPVRKQTPKTSTINQACMLSLGLKSFSATSAAPR